MQLVDTSAWIHALRNDGDVATTATVRGLLESGDAAVCDLVSVELLNGARGGRERNALQEILKSVPNLPIDAEVWHTARNLTLETRAQGVTVPSTDLVIFACAQRWEVQLTHADRHFGLLLDLEPE